MKRNILAFLFSLFVVFCTVGCKQKGMTELEAKAILDDLIPKSIDVYCVLWNTGIELKEYDKIPDDGYFEVIDEKYKSIADLKAYAENVFTKEFAETKFYNTAFEQTDDHNPIYIERNGKLFCTPCGFGSLIEWNTGEIEIVKQTDDCVTLNVSCSYSDKKEIREIVLEIVEGQWRLSSRTM